MPRSSNAVSKPDGLIRSACTWRQSAMRCSAIQFTAGQERRTANFCWNSIFTAKLFTRRSVASRTRSRNASCRSQAACRPTCRNCSLGLVYKKSLVRAGLAALAEKGERRENGTAEERRLDPHVRWGGRAQPKSIENQEVPNPQPRGRVHACQELA